ncbi:MAG: glycosyltransferase family 2 protein [Candidatus Cloacimonetes bacterium]|nr:glycosyltransferase family 2 protein [Candidatus Cloacimonadota bacterium]
MTLTIGIPCYNGREVLRECLTSVFQHIKDIDFAVIVCDDGSTDGTAEMVVKEFPRVKLLRNSQNCGVSKSMNKILEEVKKIKGGYFLRLDADTKVLAGSVEGLIDFLEKHPKAGIVAPTLVDKKGNRQRNYQEGRQKPIWWLGEYTLWFSKLFHSLKNKINKEFVRKPTKVSVLGSAAILVRKKVLCAVDFDEKIPFFMEDADFTMKIRIAGWEAWHYPLVAILHLGGHSDEKFYIHCRDRSLQSLYYFTQKHFPGHFNQIILTLSILLGSSISLVLAAIVWLPSRFNPRAKIIVDRAMRSFGNVFLWHGRNLKTQSSKLLNFTL